MRKILLIALLAAFTACNATTAANTDSGKRKVVVADRNYVTRDVKGIDRFDKINSRGIADVEYIQKDGRPSISVYGSENVLPYLKVQVSGNTLNITIDDKVQIRGEHRLKVRVSNPGLVAVSTSGTGEIDIKGILSTGDFEMSTTGTGDIDFDVIESSGKVTMSVRGTGDVDGESLRCVSLSATVSGTGDIDIDDIRSDMFKLSVSGTGSADVGGRTNEFTVTVSGTGSVKAGNLRADVVNATVSGTGSLSCYAVKELYATESGTGSIRYDGNPNIVDIKGWNRRVVRRED